MSHNHHSHTHSHNHSGEDNSTKNILVAFILNISFAIFEVIGGIYTGSTAILSDAVHDFGDSLSLGLSLLFSKFSKKAPTDKYTFGFKGLSVIGAIVNILVLFFGTVYVFVEAIQRFYNPREIISEGMIIMAFVGIFANGLSAFRLKGSKKVLDKTVMMHLMEDLLGWIAVLVVSVIMLFTKIYILDPILSLVICAIILRNIYYNTKSVIAIIMNVTPDVEEYHHIKKHLMQENPAIVHIDKFNMWSLDGEDVLVALKVRVKGNANILEQVKETLEEEGIHESTIEIAYVE